MTANSGAELLFRNYEAALREYVARKLPAQEVDDVVSEVYVRFLCCNVRSVDDPDAYVFGIARNVINDRLRAADRDSHCVQLEPGQLEAIRDKASTPDELVEQLETRRRFHDAMSRLPKTQLAVLVMKSDGLSAEEIGSELGLKAGTVDTYLSRAIKKMRSALKNER